MVITSAVPEIARPEDLIAEANGMYKSLQDQFTMTEDEYFKDLVCPKSWKEHPFDRWFKLKEGYSSLMIEKLLKEFGAKQPEWLLDPFLGSGSSAVGARNAGINVAGFEVNPFLYNLGLTKMHEYPDPAILKVSVGRLFADVHKKGEITIPTPKLSITQKLFREQLETLLRVKQEIQAEPDGATRSFLQTGLGCILQRVSYAKKDGNGLKYPKNREPLPLLPTLQHQYELMIEDVSRFNSSNQRAIKHFVLNTDSRQAFKDIARAGDLINNPFVGDMIDNLKHVIFSPPYCNCFDYTEVYKIELWMMDHITEYSQLKVLRKKSLSSHLNKSYEQEAAPVPELQEIVDIIPWNATWGKNKMKNMVLNYFKDMKDVFANVDTILNDDGEIVCIVGNSAYANVPIATDVFLSLILKRMGYDDIEIRVARRLSTSSQQQKYLKNNPYLRESLIIARK
ncbi:MAG: hypothetical protein ACTSUE_15440 [Promethearchaeota archaeon]